MSFIRRLTGDLFAFASYNAGPAKVARLRREAKKMGLNPNVWFRNVEIVASKRIGRETVQYVSNIYKYYVAYSLISDRSEKKEEVKKRHSKESPPKGGDLLPSKKKIHLSSHYGKFYFPAPLPLSNSVITTILGLNPKTWIKAPDPCRRTL